MATKKIEAVFTTKAPKPLPQFSQAVKYNGMVYCSGNIGIDPETSKLVEGTITDRTVSQGEVNLF
jgi:2-iminobutanoate/2-iminopropanoate deaminase